MTRGAVIVFEGADRSGKTTQCSELSRKLSNINVSNKRFSFPTRKSQNPISDLVLKLVRKELTLDPPAKYLLFTAERFSHLRSMIDSIEAGETLIIDRYVHSGIAYGCANGLQKMFCQDKENGLLKPDLVVYLTSDEQTFRVRQPRTFEVHDNMGFQNAVLQEYSKLIQDDWLVVDGSKDIRSITTEILPHVLNTVIMSGTDH